MVHICPFECIRRYESLSVVSVHAWMHTCTLEWSLHWSVIMYLCGACKQNRYESVLWFHKWTLDPLRTRWRKPNLASMVYLSLYTMTGVANCVYSLCLCSFDTKTITSQKDNLSSILYFYFDRLRVQCSLQVEVFPVCFLEKSMNLNFVVRDCLSVVLKFKDNVLFVEKQTEVKLMLDFNNLYNNPWQF